MKMVKSLILGSAAGLVAMSGAQAADLPVKAKAVEYVRICSLYGAGFWYIPGTDTCIKLGGYVRIDTTFNSSTVYDAPAYSGDSGQVNRYRDYFIGRSRMAITVDTRTATEYGVVRTFGQGDFQFQQFGTANNAALSAAPTAPGGFNNALLSNVGGGYVAVEMVFIQFAGFTFGKSASAYATPWHGYPGNNSSFLVGGHDTVTGVQNIQYTAQFGNGVSGTIGLDDPTQMNRTSIYNLSAGLSATGAGPYAYGGTHAPDIVGNIRVDQAWGLFQISGAAHLVNASYNVLAAGTGFPTNLSEINGHPTDKWGGSVMAALNIKNIPTGPGDDIKVDASFAVGDTKNVISTSGATPNYAMFNGSGRAYQGIGFGVSNDAIFAPAFFGGTGDLKLTKAFGVRGAFNHNWDPFWSSSIFGAAAAVRYDGSVADLTSAKGQYCATYNLSNPGAKSADYSCNPDYNVFMVGAVTRWTPVKNLTFSAEVLYFRLDQKFTGTSVLAVAAPKPITTYEYKDQDTVALNVRVQRNF
jgi:Porin subfamily